MPYSISRGETAGGIPVFLESSKGTNAGFMVGVRTGSRDEDASLRGISHLLEHTVFRETRTMDSFEMAKLMEGAGGALNAFTGKEMTAFFGVTLRETSDVAMRCVGDIVSDPLINEKDTELEKSIVLQELSMIRTEPDEYIHSLAEKNLWDGNPLADDEGGTEETVGRLTHEDLRKYYGERYGRQSFGVYAIGDISLEDAVSWAENNFDGMNAEKIANRETPAKCQAGLFNEDNGSDHCRISVLFPYYKPDSERRFAASVLGAALGMGTSSRLFQQVREKNALVYSVYASNNSYTDAGYVGIFLSCDDKNSLKSLDEIVKVLKKFKKDGMEKDEMERTKNVLKGSLARSEEKTSSRLYAMCNGHMTHGEVLNTDEKLARIDAVTEDDVMREAESILIPDKMNVTVLGRCGDWKDGYSPSENDF